MLLVSQRFPPLLPEMRRTRQGARMLPCSGSAFAHQAPELLVASIFGTLLNVHHTHGEAELSKKLKSKGSGHQLPFERLHESLPQDSMRSYQLMLSAVRLFCHFQ